MLVIVGAAVAVLLADRLVVWKHLNERFWPNSGCRPEAGARRPVARTASSVFQFSPDLFLTQLRRYVDPRAHASPPRRRGEAPVSRAHRRRCVVYRDFVPFVGAGVPEDPWSIAVPLEELPDAEPTAELTTESLYAGIRDGDRVAARGDACSRPGGGSASSTSASW